MSEATSYFAIAIAVFILLADLWAIISVFRSDKTVGVKAAWAIGLIIFPVLGLIVWGIAGPRGIKQGPSSTEHSKGQAVPGCHWGQGVEINPMHLFQINVAWHPGCFYYRVPSDMFTACCRARGV